MKRNRIREVRRAQGLSQRELAELAGTSQQQVQRIEAGVQAVRYDLACSISAALKTPLPTLFPDAAAPLRAPTRAAPNGDRNFSEEGLGDQLYEAGIDIDPRIWTFVFRLRGGFEGQLVISSGDQRRLWAAVQCASRRSERFVVFDSGHLVVVLNLDHLSFCQFLLDPPSDVPSNLDAPAENDTLTATAYLADSPKPITLEVEADTATLEDEDEGRTEEGAAQLQHLLFMAELSHEPDDVLSIVDADGERAFFRAADLTMLTLPVTAVEPATVDDDDDVSG